MDSDSLFGKKWCNFNFTFYGGASMQIVITFLLFLCFVGQQKIGLIAQDQQHIGRIAVNGSQQSQQIPDNWESCSLLECADTIAESMQDANINVHFDGDINSHILVICFPSILHSPIVMVINGSRPSKRFKMPMNDLICEKNCKNCSKDGFKFKWHGIELRWASGIVKLRSSLLNGEQMDLSLYVKQNFNGSVKGFLKALMSPSAAEDFKNKTNNIFIAKQYDDAAMVDGVFLEDLIAANSSQQQDYYLRELHLQLSLALNFVDKNPKLTEEGLTLYAAIKPSNNSWAALLNETKLEKCLKKIVQWNLEAGFKMFDLDRWHCLLSEEAQSNLRGHIDEPPPNGAHEEWGGGATEPRRAPAPLTFEEERARMNSPVVEIDPQTVDPKYGGVGGGDSTAQNRAKRHAEGADDCKCKMYAFDVRNQWPKCRNIINNIRNQGSCGSCWAVAAASALTDRTCIFVSKKRPWANFDLDANRFASARDAMECTYDEITNCKHGGSADKAWKYYTNKGTVNGYCKPYVSKSPRYDWESRCHYGCDRSSKDGGSLDFLPWGNHLDRIDFGGKDELEENTWIANKQHSGLLYSTTEYYRYYYSNENVERLMIEQLETNGTINAALYAGEKFTSLKKNAVLNGCAKMTSNHDVRIIGYGYIQCKNSKKEFLPQKFWLAANSWGAGWKKGQGDGTFLVHRGANECNIESDVCWGTLDMFPFRKDAGSKNVKS